MNAQVLKGKWTEIKGELQHRWGKLTDSEYDQIAGDQEKLVGRLQKLYGYNKEQAEREVKNVIGKL